MKLLIKLILGVATVGALAFTPLEADAKKGGQGGLFNNFNKGVHARDDDKVLVNIDMGDRRIIRDYLMRDARRHCPPGLAKKNPPCIPPGQAKKWRIGYPLPGDVRFSPLGDDLLSLLSPLPPGYRYAQVDRDVLLLSEAGKKVIDAVTLASAAGN